MKKNMKNNMKNMLAGAWAPTTAVLEARIGKILRTTAALWLAAASGVALAQPMQQPLLVCPGK